MILLFIYFSILLISIAVYNAYFVLEITGNKEKRKFYSHIWHIIGLGIRVYIWISIPLIILLKQDIINSVTGIGVIMSIKWSVIFALFGGLFYDVIINLIRYLHEGTPKLTYVDYKNWNKFFVDIVHGVVGFIDRKLLRAGENACTLEEAKDIWFWIRIITSLVLLFLLTI